MTQPTKKEMIDEILVDLFYDRLDADVTEDEARDYLETHSKKELQAMLD